jgi:hypothetical protein
MKINGELEIKLSDESKKEIFYTLMWEKFGFHKDYFIEGASVYEMRPNGVGQEPYFLKKASPLQMCIFEIFKQLK